MNDDKSLIASGGSKELSHGDEPIQDDRVVIEVLYLIDAGDRKSVEEIENTKDIKCLKVSKFKDGTLVSEIIPRPKRVYLMEGTG